MIVAGNWKMNLSINEAIELSNDLLIHNEIFVEENIIIFPSFPIIFYLCSLCTKFFQGLSNLHF